MLAQFAPKRSEPAAPDVEAAPTAEAADETTAPRAPRRSRNAVATPEGRRRGQGATVALSCRLARGDWERLHQLAVSEGISLQQLILRGLSREFAAKGLPGIGG